MTISRFQLRERDINILVRLRNFTIHFYSFSEHIVKNMLEGDTFPLL